MTLFHDNLGAEYMYVQALDSPNFSDAGFTIVLWMRMPDAGTWNTVFGLINSPILFPFPRMWLSINEGAGPILYNSPGPDLTASLEVLPLNTWCRFMIRMTAAGVVTFSWGVGLNGALNTQSGSGCSIDSYNVFRVGQGDEVDDAYTGDIIGLRFFDVFLDEDTCQQELNSIWRSYRKSNVFINAPMVKDNDTNDYSGNVRNFNQPFIEEGSLSQRTTSFPPGPTLGPKG